MKFKVKLNGTNVNSWHPYGLKQNPFPQMPKAEYMPLNNLLNNLAAEPIGSIAALKEKLEGASQEFIDLCCSKFKVGERVEFCIEFPD